MTVNDPISPIRLQLMWDRLIAVVEEQAQTLIRTGFSTSTREERALTTETPTPWRPPEIL